MILIVQPWFSAIGHPAQSLLNTAKVIGFSSEIKYLVSIDDSNSTFAIAVNNLKKYGDVIGFNVTSASLFEGTFKALLQLRNIYFKANIDRVLFFDADFVLLSIMWAFSFFPKKPPKVGIVYLHGPERILKRKFIRFLIKRFLERPNTILFLRTDELVNAWRIYYPNAKIMRLPTIEIPNDEAICPVKQMPVSTTRFAVLGQIRVGKGLSWIVPLFQKNSELGQLTVAGQFASNEEKLSLSFLNNFSGFINKYLTEEELLEQATNHDYLLMLYDEWDTRLEGAIMFLAAKSNTPVIVYDEGWCGRMVKTYKNGICLSKNSSNLEAALQSLPKPGSDEYQILLRGVNDFKVAHSGEVIRTAFLKAIYF
jgi:hypothetical protein